MASCRMILCLGPHRSGTSTVTAALGVLGADLALPDIYANEENAKGFFEQPDILAFDERLLAALGGAWDVPDFDCAAALRACPDAGQLQDEAVALVRRLFGTAPTAAMKDPRQCMLLPFWYPVLRAAGFDEIIAVHVLRDPVEVAVSQRARAIRSPDYYEIGRNLAEGAALWLGASCQMWQDFGAARHVLIGYDRLVDAPVETLATLAARLDLSAEPAALDRFAADFIDPALRRSRVTPADRAEVAAALPQALAAHDALLALADARVLAASDVAPLSDLWSSSGTRAAVTGIMAAVPARLSPRLRAANLRLAELSDRLSAEKAAHQAHRDNAARETAALHAEAERIALAHVEERRRLDAELKSEIARIISDSEAERARQAEATQRAAAAYQAQIDTLRAEMDRRGVALAQKVAEVEALYASTSWRIAAPVRALGRLARRMEAGLRRGWTWLNHFARRVYRGIFARSPRAAETLRKVAAPVIHRGNRAILQRDYVPAAESLSPASLDHPADRLAYQRPGRPAAPLPLVSVIVPNFNHAPYLRQRLDSVYAQTYAQFEVILMDDCSKDDSRAILTEYAERYPDRTRVIFNEVNSGGAFFQWEKGIRAAKGDLVWIAESDDWCTPDFLASLVPFFANDGVQMAYAPTIFMNEAGTEETWTLWDYLSGLGPERWRAPFVLPAPVIVREAFAARNIIPNTSSAIFRRPDPDRLDALEAPVWRGMRTSGDWVFYLNLIRGGMLAYSPQARNYFRQHPANTSVGSFTQDRYYREHEEVAKTVQRHYRVDPEIFRRQKQDLLAHWARHRGGLDVAGLEACYDLNAIAAEARLRKPNVLMAGFAFAAGGGETFPIALANLMKTAGYTVTFLTCDQEPAQPGIRAQLAADIPVLSNFEDLNGIVRDFDIGLIHSHHAWVDNTVLDLLPENTPVRTVITLHGMYETILDGPLRRMLPRLVRRTAKMVYIAEKNTEAMVQKGGLPHEALVRTDNALPRGGVVPAPRAELGIPEEAFVLTLVSRGIPEKGWEEAIAAVDLARSLCDRDIRLVILGNGPEYDRLAAKAPPHVHFAGFRANTRDYFAMADLGLLPSRFRGESFPLVLIDCLNAGRPMLASDLGEIARMLDTPDGPAGEVFALNDWQVPVEALARRIAALAADPAALAALTARVPAAAAKFDPEKMRDAYAEVYRQAAAG